MTGFNLDIACFVIFAVCIFYTAIGGIKAVMWTDVFQVTWLNRYYESGRVELFNFNPDPRRRHTVWGLVIGGFFTWISIYGINQTQVQRYLTVRKTSQAAK